MRQFGLDTVYAGLRIEQEAEGSTFDYSPVSVDLSSVSIFDLATQGYGHDKALSAYVSLAFDDMLENITERGSIDIETDDATLFCCACAACAGEQEAGPVMIDGFVTLASLLQSDMGDETADTYLGNVLEDAYGIDQADASQYLFNPVTGEFVLVEGFDGQLTKGATLELQDDGTAIVNGGASSATATAAASGDQRIDGVINGDYWSNSSISYAFSLSAAAYDYAGTGNEALPDNFNQAISAMQEASAHFALSSTQGVAAAASFSVEGFTNLDVNFEGNVDSATAEIRFAETSDPGTGTARVSDFPGGQVTSSPNDDGDVWFGVAANFRIAEAGNYQWMTMIHEIGHALGLKHGHLTYNFGALPSDVDSTEYSIMTYRSYIGQNPNGGATNEQWGFPQTFMMFDIAALQYFHGADFTANSGDTIYSWDPTSGDTVIDGNIAIAPGGNRIYATIWDGDGVDTYDLSAYATGVSIDLSPGGFSVFSAAQQASIGGGNFARGNIFNALQYQGDARSLIENAIGGSGDDIFTGNAADNSFTGGSGTDTADYSAITDDLTVSLGTAPGASSVEAGTDVFDSIENFISGSGSDVIDGSAVANTIKGGDGDDTIDGMDGDDVLWGEIGDDTIFGGAGDDILRGGNDLATGGPVFGDGMITRAEGAGNDSIANALSIDDDYSLAADVDVANSETIPHVTVSATGDGTVHFYSFTVHSNGDNVSLDIDYGETGGAGSFDSYLELYDANGNLLGSNDAFPFVGGAGGSTSSNDALLNLTIPTAGVYYVAVMETGGGAVPVNATYELQVSVQDQSVADPDSGSDTLNGGVGDDMLFGGAGTDYAAFSGIQANYTVTDNMDGTYLVIDNDGTDGTDTLDNIEFLIFSDVTIDIVTAADGMSGGGGDIDGTTGNDNPLNGTSDDDVINGLAGDDTIFGLAGDDVLNGGGGRDILRGGEGNDTLNGDAGNDDFYGGAGADVMNGGAGADRVFYSTATAGITANFIDQSQNTGEAAGDTYTSIESITGSQFDDVITSGGDNNDLVGLGGNDVLNGAGGRDRLFGGNGDDRLLGGLGNDDLHGQAGADTYVIQSGAGADRIFTYEAGVDLIQYIGGPGDMADLTIEQLGANTRITSIVGVLTLMGIDATTITAADFSFVNPLADPTGVTVTTDLTSGNDTFTGDENDDVVNGLAGNDTIRGGIGDDTLNGGDGNDLLTGGLGADVLNGGDGIDRVLYSTASTGVTINVLNPTLNTGEAAGDTYISIENFSGSNGNDNITSGNDGNQLIGLGGDDVLIGAGGNDTLFGGDDNDRLVGGADNDTLFGQEGEDTFVFFAGAGNDTIRDFEDGVDMIEFRDLVDDFTDLTITQSGANTVITSANGTITISDFDSTLLDAADFVFI